ncbi:MAG: DUF2291 domain-containing protein [Eubacterium sp.]|nr:DUF2291 domain-containing protein [Eubacterium sp.]
MKRIVSTISLLALVAFTTTGCGIVTVVPIGEEASFTNESTFDAGEEAADSWDVIVEEITANAQDLATLKAAGTEKKATYSVSFTGTVEEYNTDTPKGYLLVSVDGVSDEVHVAVGKVFSGTSVRDSQTYKSYQDFTNQTEWSEYAKTINENVMTNVVESLDLESITGSTVNVVGCFAEDESGTIVVTPVSITVQ